jgi:hypothetical protein
MRICTFVADHGKWQSVISKRAANDLDLTRKQQLSYNIFLAGLCQKYVFNKKKKTMISDASGVKRNMKDCIAFKLHLSEVPENLQVETGDGNIFRLVWLKNKQPAPEGEVPNVLDRPAKMDDFPDDEKEGGMTMMMTMEKEMITRWMRQLNGNKMNFAVQLRLRVNQGKMIPRLRSWLTRTMTWRTLVSPVRSRK